MASSLNPWQKLLDTPLFQEGVHTKPIRPGFDKAMADLLATPGYNSDEAAKHGGHEAYMRFLKARPSEITGAWLDEAATMSYDEWSNLQVNAEGTICPIEAFFWGANTAREAWSRICDGITEGARRRAAKRRTTLDLWEPKTLTVRDSAGAYKKAPHIGGEKFTVNSIYMGKRGSPVICLSPCHAAPYAQAEMLLDEALVTFTRDIDAALDQALSHAGLRYEQAVGYASKLATQEQEEKFAQDRFETYADKGFGSW